MDKVNIVASIGINTIHQELKLQTSDAHKSLDSNALLIELMSPSLNQALYAHILDAMQQWFFIAEKILANQLCEFLDLAYMQGKHALLLQDLNHLKYPCTRNVNSNLFAGFESSIDSVYKALGLLYVVEGSTLGGMVIAPRVKKTLGADTATAFYSCYGKNKVSNFASTLSFIDNAICDKSQIEEAVTGALVSFKSLQDFLDKLANKTTTRAG